MKPVNQTKIGFKIDRQTSKSMFIKHSNFYKTSPWLDIDVATN